ncbi:MAG: beta strand repeat-containing protein, partial [Candidatus Micrarchaeales archaeon]
MNPIFGNNATKFITLLNSTLTVPYGTLLHNGKYAAAGTAFHILTYNDNNTLADYNITVVKATPNLVLSMGGVTATGQRQTLPVSVPILQGQKTYNVSIFMSSNLLGPNYLNYTYRITRTDISTHATTLTLSANITASNISKTITLTGIPANQSVEVTFDVAGNANYTSVDPSLSTVPSSILYYLPITLTNHGTVATTNPFQEEIQVNSNTYSAYETNNLQNIEFFYANGILVPSWLEGNTFNQANAVTYKDTADTYWLSINQIAGSGTETVYMGFAATGTNLFDGVTVGESPNKSLQAFGTYGLYDNGKDVFPYYQSFGGLSALPTGWSITSGSGTGTFTTSNYLIGAGTNNYGGIFSSASYLITGNVFSVAISIPSSTSAFKVAGFGVGVSGSSHTSGYFLKTSGSKGCDTFAETTCYGTVTSSSTAGAALGYFGRKKAASGAMTQVTAETFITSNTYPTGVAEVYGIGFTSTNTYFFEKNSQSNTLATVPGTTTLPISIISNVTGLSVDWVRIWTMPPGNVMPTTAFGALTSVLSTNGVGNNGNFLSVSNTILDVGQISIVNAIVTGGLKGYTSNWFWIAPNGINGGAKTGNTVPFTISNTAPANVVLIFNAISANEVILQEGPPGNTIIATNTLSTITADNALGSWTINALIIDSNGLGTNSIITSANTISVNSQPKVSSFTQSNSAMMTPGIDTYTLTLTNPGGTGPFTVNFVYTNNGVTANEVDGVSIGGTATNTLEFDAGGTYTVNAIVTDTGTTSEYLFNSLTLTSTVNSGVSGTSIVSSNSVVDQGQTETLTYTWSGGTPNYIANILVTNTVASPANIIANSITSGIAGTSQTLTFTVPSNNNALGTGQIYANVLDSMSTNYLMTNTITINPQLTAAAPTKSNS